MAQDRCDKGKSRSILQTNCFFYVPKYVCVTNYLSVFCIEQHRTDPQKNPGSINQSHPRMQGKVKNGFVDLFRHPTLMGVY